MSKKRVKFAGDYPGANVTPVPTSDGPRIAEEQLAVPVLLAGPTWLNAERSMGCDPATGVVEWNRQHTLRAPNRKRHELLPNKTAATYTSVGMEGAPVLTGSAGFAHLVPSFGAPGHFLEHDTGALANDWCTSRLVNFHQLFKWVWNPTVAITFRTSGDLTNQRIWVGPTREELNGLQLPDNTPAVGGTARSALLRYDSSVNGNWHAVWHDGSAGAQDLGIAAAVNTTYRMIVEYDEDTDAMRWYLYNQTAGTNHGLVHTRTMSIAATLTFGVECLIETLEALGKVFYVGRIVVECN